MNISYYFTYYYKLWRNHNLTSNLLINICLHLFHYNQSWNEQLWALYYFVPWSIPKGELMSHREYAFVVFKDSAKLFLHWSFNNIPSASAMYEISSFLHSFPNVMYCHTFEYCQPDGWKMVFDAVLICIFPPHCVISVSCLVNYLSISFAQFLLGCCGGGGFRH